MDQILTGMTRQIAAQNSDDAELESLFREMGVKSTTGHLTTEDAEKEREKIQAAKTEKIQTILDTKKPAPSQSPSSTQGPSGTPGVPFANSGAVALDMGKDALMQVMGGAADSIQSLYNAGADLADYLDNNYGNGKLISDNHDLSFAKDWFPESQYAPNKLIRGVSQFMVPYLGITRGLGLAGAVSKGIAAVATDFLAFPGDQQRISNLIQEVPELANPITDYLQAKPGDTEFEGRFKNVLEGLGLGAITEGFAKSLKFVKAKKAASGAMEEVARHEAGIVKPGAAGEPGQIAADNADFDKSLQKFDEGTGNVPAKKPTLSLVKENIPAGPPVPKDLLEKVNITPEEALKSVDQIGKGGGYQLNLTKIDSDTDVLTAIKNFAEKDKAALEKRIGPKQSEQQLPLLAKQLGVSVEDLLAKRPGEAFSGTELYAARTFHAAAAENLVALAKVAQTGSDADKYAFMQGVQAFKAINLVLTGAKAEAGRALQSLKYRVKAGDPNSAKMISAFLENSGRSNISNLAQNIANLPPEEVSKVIRKSKFQKLTDAAFEVRVNNLLSRVSTLAKNEVGNMAMTWYTNLERGIAPFWSSAKAQVDPEILKSAIAQEKALRKVDIKTLSFGEAHAHQEELNALNNVIQRAASSSFEHGELSAATSGLNKEIFDKTMSQFSGFFDGMRGLFKTVFSRDPEQYKNFFSSPSGDYFSKAEAAGYHPAISSQELGGGPLVDIFGGIQRIPTKALNWRDDFYKAVNYRGEVHGLAYRTGIKQGLSGEELSKFVDDFAKDPPDSIRLMAEDRARTNTFTNVIDGSWGEKIHDLIQEDVAGVQPLKWVIPFSRTPINISYELTKRTPLAPLTDSWKRAMVAGGAQAQLAKTQMALGSSIMATMTGLAYTGLINGRGPSDPKMQKLMKDDFVPYSFNIGGKQVSTSILGEPLSSLVNLAADMGEISSSIYTEWDEREASEVGALISWTAINHLGSDNMVRGFSELFDAIHSDDPKELIRMSQGIASSLVPLTGMASNVRSIKDPVQRDLYTYKTDPYPYLQGILNQVRDKIPGLSTKLPPRKNIFGEDVLLPKSIGFDGISPFYTNRKNPEKDPVLKELARLGYSGPFAKAEPAPGETHLSINMPPKDLSFGGNRVPLDANQYAKYVELSGGIGLSERYAQAFHGKTLRETLSDVIKNNYADHLPNEKFRTDQAKRIVIKNIILGYRNAAKGQMFEEDPTIHQRLNEAVKRKADAFGVTIDTEEKPIAVGPVVQ